MARKRGVTLRGISTKAKPKQNLMVARAFLAQSKLGDHIMARGNVVVSSYALQVWGDENTGGEALLKYIEPKGWALINNSGGAWDVDQLVNLGVPRAYAERLVAGLRKQW